MKTKLLLPNGYKKMGWIILVPSLIMGIVLLATNFEALGLRATVFAIYGDEIFGDTVIFGLLKTYVMPTLVGVLFIIGALLVAFSKEKREDEYIASLRLSSFLWAVLVNYLLLMFCFLFIYGGGFFSVMLYNMFTMLIIFIARFNFLLYRNSKTISNEK